jgi:hypothetical protein
VTASDELRWPARRRPRRGGPGLPAASDGHGLRDVSRSLGGSGPAGEGPTAAAAWPQLGPGPAAHGRGLPGPGAPGHGAAAPQRQAARTEASR